MNDVTKKLEQTQNSNITQSAQQSAVQRAQQYWHTLGPGLTTGASDDDPSGIATYSQAGSQYGFQLLWLAVFTFPLMAVVQEMCARIGLVTGRGLAANIRQHYSKKVLYTITILLFAANIFNISADLAAVAAAVQLLVSGLNTTFLILFFAVLSLILQIFTSYKDYAKYLKWLALILLAYVFSALVANLDWQTILVRGIIPSISWSWQQVFLITAVLGTTISPYLFFWQTSQEVEEEILRGKTTLKLRRLTSAADIKHMRTDVWSGMFLSNLVMFFIIAVCAGTLYQHGITNITTAAQAAEALKPLAGSSAYLLFALGIIGTGLLAIPVLAGSASYALSESFGWREGLYRKFKQAHAFYGVIIVAMILGFLLNFLDIDPISALIYSAVGNGLVAPVILIFIVQMSSKSKIMGEHSNGFWTSLFGWLITATMMVAGFLTLISFFVQ